MNNTDVIQNCFSSKRLREMAAGLGNNETGEETPEFRVVRPAGNESVIGKMQSHSCTGVLGWFYKNDYFILH